MNLIDTYVSEVGRRLPRKSRADIEAEIRSTLEDMLETASKKAGRPVDDELTLAVLKEFGSPEKVAASYLPERYLVGPQLYPIFTLVVRIVLTVLTVLAMIGLGIALGSLVEAPNNAFETVVKALANWGAGLMSALGNIVLIFAIIEWAIYRSGGKPAVKGIPAEKEWDPRSLTKISPPDRVRLGGTITEITFSFAAIVLFNFYPQWIGYTPSLNGVVGSGWAIGFGSNVTFVPLLSEAFFHYVPYLTLAWALTILLDIVLLRIGFWNTVTRICLIGLKIIGIIIAAAMLAGPSLAAVTVESLTAGLGDAGAAQILFTMLTQFVNVLLWLAILLSAYDAIRVAYRLIAKSPQPAFATKK